MSVKMTSLLCLAALNLTVACGGDDDDSATGTPDAHVDTILALTGDATAGKAVHDNTCAPCHGANGEGISGYSPALTDEFKDLSDAEIVSVVINGYGADMPPQSALSDQDVADVLAYGRETYGSP